MQGNFKLAFLARGGSTVEVDVKWVTDLGTRSLCLCAAGGGNRGRDGCVSKWTEEWHPLSVESSVRLSRSLGLGRRAKTRNWEDWT